MSIMPRRQRTGRQPLDQLEDIFGGFDDLFKETFMSRETTTTQETCSASQKDGRHVFRIDAPGAKKGAVQVQASSADGKTVLRVSYSRTDDGVTRKVDKTVPVLVELDLETLMAEVEDGVVTISAQAPSHAPPSRTLVV